MYMSYTVDCFLYRATSPSSFELSVYCNDSNNPLAPAFEELGKYVKFVMCSSVSYTMNNKLVTRNILYSLAPGAEEVGQCMCMMHF